MSKPAEAQPRPIVGASIPRSGHHHLSRLAKAYFGDDLRYCAVYGRNACCGAVPCTKGAGRRLTFQKSHDFTFRLQRDVPNAIYVVQHRSPVENVLSAAELIATKRGMKGPRDGVRGHWAFHDFLASKLVYYKRFHDKWIVSPPAHALLVDYAELASAPDMIIRRLAHMVDGHADELRIAEVVAAFAHVRSHGVPYVPRQIEASAFFHRADLAAFEAAVLAQCPAYGYAPKLGGRRYKLHPLWALAILRHGLGSPTTGMTTESGHHDMAD